MLLVIQICIICDEHIIWDHPLYYRMSPVFDIDHAFFIDFGPYVVIPLGYKRKGGEHIECRHCLRCLLDPLHFGSHCFPDFRIELIFQGVKLIFRSQDHILQFL